ncbi:MAG: hypothetical protein M1442_02060 [Candidatus Thermoplasmatota archaeon]|nr:hypothetical protein [Candidatus Thermoplasmatota archaeon]
MQSWGSIGHLFLGWFPDLSSVINRCWHLVAYTGSYQSVGLGDMSFRSKDVKQVTLFAD